MQTWKFLVQERQSFEIPRAFFSCQNWDFHGYKYIWKIVLQKKIQTILGRIFILNKGILQPEGDQIFIVAKRIKMSLILYFDVFKTTLTWIIPFPKFETI